MFELAEEEGFEDQRSGDEQGLYSVGRYLVQGFGYSFFYIQEYVCGYFVEVVVVEVDEGFLQWGL